MAKAKEEITDTELKTPEKNTKTEVSKKPKVSLEITQKEASKSVAKAGKRSAKAIGEAEAKHIKEEKKLEPKTTEKSKITKKPTRTILERRSKKYKEVNSLIDKNKEYLAKDALDLAIKTSITKFDASVELHIRLGVDPKQADQNVRDSLILPSGTGKEVRIAVFVDEDDSKASKDAGADIAGIETITKSLDKNEIDFDVLIAPPNQMVKLAKYARILGPRGLMPNPKSGTVTADVVKAIKQAKAGRVEYRVDSTGIIHLGIGKVSFGKDKLASNLIAVLESVKQNKPASLKGVFCRSIYISSTMGPSIRVSATESF